MQVRRKKGTQFNPKNTIKMVKYPPSKMAWGCFSGQGRGGLEFLPKGVMMNSIRYTEIPAENCFHWMIMNDSDWLLQDSSPCHTTHFTKAFIQERGPAGIQIVDWPGNSPDLGVREVQSKS